MTKVDILFSASVYRSAPSAVRMAESVRHINGNHLVVLTAHLSEDAEYLQANPVENTVVFLTPVDNMYFARNWGFLWAINSGVSTRFYCSCDDDIEFLPHTSADIVERLRKNDYAAMTFLNGSHRYNIFGGEDVGSCRKVGWFNGDSMFTRIEDNLRYGLPDCLPGGSPMPYFVESEYLQRLRAMSGKPLLVDLERQLYTHHHRDDPTKVALRSENANAKIASGLAFFYAKYPGCLPPSVDVNQFDIHTATYNHIRANLHSTHTRRHLLYGGAWTDYTGLFNQYSSEHTLIYDGRR